MKKITLIIPGIVVLLAIITISWNIKSPSEILEIGAKAPLTGLSMDDVSGRGISLDEIKKKNGLLVIFSCNTCPFVVGNGEKSEGWQNRYPEIGDIAGKNDIGFVLVNPNEKTRSSGDSMEDMKRQYDANNYNGYYVLDKDHKLADAFGAKTTPHVYLFDQDMKLIYKGAIDDNVSRRNEVKEPYLINAINNHIKKQPIDPNSTRQLGCSIKRV